MGARSLHGHDGDLSFFFVVACVKGTALGSGLCYLMIFAFVFGRFWCVINSVFVLYLGAADWRYKEFWVDEGDGEA